jgi:glycosyltransferase involved in cell wall biosynthesis
MEKLSIIVPCYNEQEMIPIFFDEVEKLKLPLKLEYIFINDGSDDNTLEELKKLYVRAPEKVRYLSFSRNFGKEAGIYAGLVESTGDYIVLMDVDLQDPPQLLPEMYDLLKTTDYDSIGTRRVSREGEPVIRSFFARMFYKIINKISDVEIVDGARDYQMMTRKMVNAIIDMQEYNRFSKGIFRWVGFKTKYLEYENIERVAGETKWSFWGLFRYSIEGIVSFSVTPLRISSILGIFTFLIAIFMALFFMIRTLVFDNPTSGWTSLIVVILGLGGLQLFSIGVLGEYLGRTFMETKRRPLYFIKETEKNLEEGKNEYD